MADWVFVKIRATNRFPGKNMSASTSYLSN